jgi:hypothetical protein
MFRSIHRQVAVLLVIGFLLGLVNCALADICPEDCGDGHAQSQCQCVFQCGCHTPAVTDFIGNAIAPTVESHRVVFPAPRLKLRLFVASIFNPPKA